MINVLYGGANALSIQEVSIYDKGVNCTKSVTQGIVEGEVTRHTGNSKVSACSAWQKWKSFARANNIFYINNILIQRYYFGSSERTAMTKTTATMLFWVIFRSTIIYIVVMDHPKRIITYFDIFLDIILYIKTNFKMHFPVRCILYRYTPHSNSHTHSIHIIITHIIMPSIPVTRVSTI